MVVIIYCVMGRCWVWGVYGEVVFGEEMKGVSFSLVLSVEVSCFMLFYLRSVFFVLMVLEVFCMMLFYFMLVVFNIFCSVLLNFLEL